MSYKRNQVEEAIARIVAPNCENPPSELRSRIKRLLDLDRSIGRKLCSEEAEEANFGFFSGEATGTGADVSFSEYEAFALFNGLRIMNHGWPQSFAVSIMRRVRVDLEKEHARILRQDPKELFDREAIRAKAREGDIAVDNTDPVFLTLASKEERASDEGETPQLSAVLRGPEKVSQFSRDVGASSVTTFEVATPAHRLHQALMNTLFSNFDGRNIMRSLADALEKLRELGGLRGTGNIECNTLPIHLPNGRVSGLVSVIGPRQDNGRRWIIRMSSAAKFSAMSTTKVRQTFEIGMLNGAISDQDGNVTLHNGQHVHGVELIPVAVHYDFDSTQHAIVWHALKLLGKLDECWHSVDDKLLPGIKYLDYSKILNIRIQGRKQLLYDIGKYVDGVSASFIAKTLADAGMRGPRSSA
jgi:hypothetical protein